MNTLSPTLRLTHLWFVLMGVCFPSYLMAQQLVGYVTRQNSGNEPVGNVEVKSMFANQTVTTSDGEFNLTFQGAKPGRNVTIDVFKENWIVINKEKLNLNLPEDPKNNKLKIVMCLQSVYEANKNRIRKDIERNIMAIYEKKLKAIDQQKEGHEKLIADLQIELQRLQSQLDKLAEEYSNTNLDDLNEKEKEAYKLFDEGKYEESRKLRASFESEKNYLKALSERAKIKNEKTKLDSIDKAKIEEVAFHERNLKREALEAQQSFDFKTAENKLEFLVSRDTTNFDNTFEFAYFLDKQNQHDKAIRYYQRALQLAKTEPDVAMTQNNLGILYNDKNEFPLALKAYTTALGIYERLAKTNPASYEPDVATTQNNLGNLFKDKNEYSLALQAYTRALEIRERLAKTNPASYEPFVATTQNNLGNLYQAKNEFPLALNAYSTALEIYERLAKTNPVTYEPDVAMTQNNLGNLFKAKNEYSLALQAYTRALEIRERLAKTNPASYEPSVAMTQNNLGILYQAKNEYALALKAYSRALEIYERLAKTNPASYEPSVAMTQNNLGILYQAKNEYALALKAYSKALEIYERLAKTNPDSYESSVATTQNNLGSLYQAKNEYSLALQAYTRALEIRERLAKTNPASYEPSVAMTQNNLGILYQVKNEYPLALKAYLRALEIRERLAKTNPDTYEPAVATTQNNLGILYQAKNEYALALQAYSRALEIYERLAKTNPASYEPSVAMTQNNLGSLFKAKNDYPSALSAYSKALEIRERLAKTNPEAHEIELCRSIVLLGLLQKADYQTMRQVQINGYLKKAKQILSKYPDIPLVKTLMEYVNDLDGYFKNVELLLPIQVLQNQLQKEISNTEKIKIQEQIIERYRYLVTNGQPQFANELGSNLSNLAWYQLLEKQFKAAEQSEKEAINPTTFKKTEDYDSKIEWANTNLALALLFQSKYTEAENIYLVLKDKPYKKATYKETFLADLDELEKAGITHPDVSKIRELLKK
ncbi:tetratricopeptide (TPR) repeat protein [Runella defluvii]|uniref:Tetratricopeptide (TPR) repeat protein n=1 Tax=Runella defluvii TaxID=370973 RepID=A0A7W5ZT25_9BACT|nr:tetratricopeptide repeat protein [Runella defluvii]MBB3841047.1 tetratricopeptide (TPR) repeat protein [Runella defluvii]